MTTKQKRATELMQAFGDAVRQYRSKAGLSQESLADRAHLDRSYLSQIERGIKNATLGSMARIAEALTVKLSELLAVTEQLFQEKLPAVTEANAPEQAVAGGRGKILIVDDDADINNAIAHCLADYGFATCQAYSGMEAIHIIANEKLGGVVTDVRMAQGNGLELLATAQRFYGQLPVFIVTGYDDLSVEEALRRGATGLFNKPFDIPEFVKAIAAGTRPRSVEEVS